MTEKVRVAARCRTAIGDNPLDALISETLPSEQPDISPSFPASGTSGRPVPGGLTKVRATFHLPAELLNEARDVVVALSGPPARLTLAELAETALRREIERLKATYNGGTDFPPEMLTCVEGGRSGRDKLGCAGSERGKGATMMIAPWGREEHLWHARRPRALLGRSVRAALGGLTEGAGGPPLLNGTCHTGAY